MSVHKGVCAREGECFISQQVPEGTSSTIVLHYFFLFLSQVKRSIDIANNLWIMHCYTIIKPVLFG